MVAVEDVTPCRGGQPSASSFEPRLTQGEALRGLRAHESTEMSVCSPPAPPSWPGLGAASRAGLPHCL